MQSGSAVRDNPPAVARIDARRATLWHDHPFSAEHPSRIPATCLAPRHVPSAEPPRRDLAAHVAAFDDLGMAALICDPTGRVLILSAAAERIVGARTILSIGAGRLIAGDLQANARLRAAIVRCGTAEDGEAERITLALTAGGEPATRLDLAPLHLGDGSVCCVVLVTENRPGAQAVQQLVSAFGLTRAEAEVAIDLAHGLSARDIAGRRSASSDTVRKQTQAIFQKLGVAKATRLAFVIGPFLR